MKMLVCCNAGMSSSILMKKIKEYALSQNEEIQIEACSMASIKDEVDKWDICLVGPQVGYAKNTIEKQLNIPVLAVNPRAYALADGKGAYEEAKKILEK